MFYGIAVGFLLVMGFNLMRMTPEKLDKINEKIEDPSKKKSLDKMHRLGKLMIGGGVLFFGLMFV